ncbi:MAG: acylneuraminate cytidylyltransferase family protein [Muribaculaceae bacterium]|nr:acylneuraminate cytidylyltransferase family protein [Muribaculaceae bacterium]
MRKTETIWLIPARGGSKGIPGKNVKSFCGRPLVCMSVDQALTLAEPDDIVFVSTDDDTIAKAAETCGPVVPFRRPDRLATDTASTYDVIIHALDEFEQRGKRFDRVVLLQPTSPLRSLDDIRNAISLWSPEIDMVVSVCEARTNPYYNAFETAPDGTLHISKGEGTYTRRQDAPKVWEYTGAVYVMTVKSLRKGPMSSFKKIIPSPMDAERAVDLDTPIDWIIAEALFRDKQSHIENANHLSDTSDDTSRRDA